MTDIELAPLLAKLERLAHQQADGTDFHKGRQLIAEDTMYWAAKVKLEALSGRISTLEAAAAELVAWYGPFNPTKHPPEINGAWLRLTAQTQSEG